MTPTPCPQCGAPAPGKFCSSCGASLTPLVCPSCGGRPSAGARFCNLCGATLAGDPRAGAGAGAAPPVAGDNTLPWAIAGVTLLALILLVAWPVIRPGEPEPPPVAGAPVAGSPPDISQMSPVQRADALFDRVMRGVSAGDEAMVQQFLPMALAAHDMARPLNADRLFHLNMLHRAGGDLAAALAAAQEGLESNPDHLLLIAGAAEAYEAMGNDAEARALWQRYLDLFDQERDKQLEEYGVHENLLFNSRDHAREFLGG